MRHIRLIKNLALAAATTTIAATTALVTSCSQQQQPEQPTLEKIDVVLAESKLEVTQGQTKAFSAPVVTCYDNYGNIMEVETLLILKTQDDLNPPSWIKLDENNQIVITGQAPGTKSFHLFAQDVEGLVTSEVQTFDVQFNAAPKVAPDYIAINCDADITNIFVTSTGNLVLTLSVWKAGYSEDQISKDCTWQIIQYTGKQTDLKGNPLFYLEPTQEDCKVCLSTDIDNDYIDTYSIQIEAVSKLNPSATCTISTFIRVLDGFNYTDAFDQVYSRQSLDDDWELTKLPSTQTDFSNILSTIYSIPVSKIGKNFCSNSGIKNWTELTIPPWIKTIGEKAFDSVYSITTISMPTVQVVEARAFYYCLNAKFVDGGEPILTDVGNYGFYQCSNIKFERTQNLVTIGTCAFAYTEMTSIDLGSYVTSIGSSVFDHCPYLSCFKISSTKPPKLNSSLYRSKTPLKAIIVPLNSVEKYRSASNWSFYSGIIAGN